MVDKIEILKGMYISRFFEEKIQELFNKGALYGTTHLNIGQEASHFGLCSALDKNDWIVPTHRTHGFNIAKGTDIYSIFSEMLGSKNGICKGLGGSMHMTDISTCNAGSSAVVGSSVPISLGLAFALKKSKKENISVAIFGDGATSRGVLHESLNLASVWNLPVLFFLENNHYGMSASSSRMISTKDIAARAIGYSMKYLKVDGNDFDAVYNATQEARKYILEHNEPFFLEVDTYRFCGHSKSDKLLYRSREEEEAYRKKDPIIRLENLLCLSRSEIKQLRDDIYNYVEAEYLRALNTYDSLTLEESKKYVYAPSPTVEENLSVTNNLSYRMAIREALSEILLDDKATLIGEDVGLYGGCFGVTGDLYERFSDKIIETPVSEEAFCGLAVGASILGERMIVEIMYGDFLTLASDALINHAAKLRYMSAGQLSCPIVLRTPIGSGTGHGAQHTQSLEAMFLNIPGLKVVAPSDPFSAKALLKAAYQDNNPVLFLEHKALYDIFGEVGEINSSFPIGKARVLREGSKATLISYSRASFTCKRALSELNEDIEHIDLATLAPLDFETIKKSILKTKKCILVEDVSFFGSVMASVAGMISQDEECFNALSSPVKIISGEESPIPFTRDLEANVVPRKSRIIEEIKTLLKGC